MTGLPLASTRDRQSGSVAIVVKQVGAPVCRSDPDSLAVTKAGDSSKMPDKALVFSLRHLTSSPFAVSVRAGLGSDSLRSRNLTRNDDLRGLCVGDLLHRLRGP